MEALIGGDKEAGRWRYPLALVGPPLILAGWYFMARALPGRPEIHALGGLLGFVAVCTCTLWAAAEVPALQSRDLLWLLAPLSALTLVFFFGAHMPQPVVAMCVTTALLSFGTIAGSVVGSGIEAPGHLLLVAIVSSLVDAASVLHPQGPTAQLVDVPAVVTVIILPWPILGTDQILPYLGVGDITFAAIYLSAGRRHHLRTRRSVLALSGGFALVLMALAGLQTAIPALPALGFAFLLAHPETRRLPAEDRNKALAVLAVLVLVVAISTLLRR